VAAAAHGAVVAELLGRVGDEKVEIYTLTNAHGIESPHHDLWREHRYPLKTPDRDGHFSTVVLGFDGWIPISPVSRTRRDGGTLCHRIGQGAVRTGRRHHQLPLNDGPIACTAASAFRQAHLESGCQRRHGSQRLAPNLRQSGRRGRISRRN